MSCIVFILETENLWKRNLQHAYPRGLKCKLTSGRNSYLLFYLLRVSKNTRLAISFMVLYCHMSEYIPHSFLVRLWK